MKPSNRRKLCRECFTECFEEDVHATIVKKNMFHDKDKICIAVSGGKDSSVLAHVLVHIKRKYNYKWDLFLLAIDEGIKGYRDDSLKIVFKLQEKYNLPLKVLKFEDIFTYTMDTVVSFIGKKNNCTVCGVFRRQAMERGALLFNATKLVTGHNADDLAETILMNMCRGDLEKLAKGVDSMSEMKMGTSEMEKAKFGACCGGECTGGEATAVEPGHRSPSSTGNPDALIGGPPSTHVESAPPEEEHTFFLPRLKPLMWCYEKEIVLYAFYKKLDYFSTECTYSPNSFRGNLRSFIKDLEMINPQFILNIIHSSEFFYHNSSRRKVLQVCTRCGVYTSNPVCKACLIVEGLRNYKDNSFLYANTKKKMKKNGEKRRIPIRYDPGTRVEGAKSDNNANVGGGAEAPA
ncbi:PP-loop family protein, putative [Plasmodium knowlesi strain H]|uniref:Cytoplasmic tRNA 2-thiolation protein 1 n=3 Tax=Plasmodium knowlesi TaxID=5850 RepID=A0A5K1V1Z8_PLAKH|nr:cytoplasmic tRNA 2-thiolation protein 1, putative [Plasmodium knowlesi strain H]OTN64794.1 Cytoplasmic tRNA 2-thiolation protein 1 [Plasmodium knowlesi]CAA9989199.1 cytoplasmic tRNA 2-thiolation protein 1, putative [Plasmodium knowlesi strain H]SBO27328.1 PP-loop family protein, putative [Plasmodium knowlesi strain H]SBO27422.1 PP-loop family protein, putative [Plasmodium knowlesi strain H]VVS78673.1 cytoplasmic tRNA 2-thiolation protein 1, putative [Plasmodium knowlesi strain H]|eukprot:XP_002261545.1 PP-loop family protein, putative [Plasmodium knowlesi strain H]